MSQEYRSRFEQMKENALQQSSPNPVEQNGSEQYPSNGNVRNICSVWVDGKKLFLAYSYMVSGEYSATESVIVLTFTTCTITVKGSNLERLFEDLMEQRTKVIACEDPRYSEVEHEGKAVVNEIVVG